MVQKIESEGAAERVAGLRGPDRSQEPTAAAPEFPSSLQDRERGSYRPSRWKRLTQIAVSNDDGSPLMAEVLAELKELNAQFRTLLEME